MTRKKAFNIALAVLLAVNIPVRAFFRLSPSACDLYALYVHPVVVRIFAPVSSLFPFSVIEVLIFIAALGIITLLVVLIIKKNRKGLVFFGKGLIITALAVFAVFLFNSEINYNRQPFSAYSGLEIRPYGEAEILSAIEILSEKIETVTVITDENGAMKLRAETDIAADSRRAMEKLAVTYPVLEAFYPRPKPVAGSRFWLSTGLITGVYSPFTLEANYNNDAPPSGIPHTVCHELSHLTGFMREDEANFIAYIACRDSDNPDFVYSGCYEALTHLVNSYYKSVDSDTYSAMYQNLPPQVRTDFAADNLYWQPFREKPRREIAETANDTYLRVNGQSDGVKSYGRCVDLIISELLF
jgi:hypothetical protein